MQILPLGQGKYVKVDGNLSEVIDLAEEIGHASYNLEMCKKNLEEAKNRLIATDGLVDDVLKLVETHNESQNIPNIEQEIAKFEADLIYLKGL